MKKALAILGALVALAVLATLALIYVPVKVTPPNEALAADWKAEPGRGKYVMRAGDCMACHTANGGSPLAGGRGIPTPMGTIWSSNITPDKETGIGDWTLDQFRAALVDGIGVKEDHLYPAMPYENYRFMSESDIRALYDYLMKEVPPVRNEVQATQLSFPFNLRFGLRAWNWLALRGESAFKPASDDKLQTRGQYLVEGAGHCAACHSPRTAFMAQDGTVARDAAFLSGGVLDGWTAPALRGADSAIATWSRPGGRLPCHGAQHACHRQRRNGVGHRAFLAVPERRRPERDGRFPERHGWQAGAGHPRAGRHARPPRRPGGPGRRSGAGHSQAADCRLARHAPGRAPVPG
nr:cytochrome c [Bordetella parapertussis]